MFHQSLPQIASRKSAPLHVERVESLAQTAGLGRIASHQEQKARHILTILIVSREQLSAGAPRQLR